MIDLASLLEIAAYTTLVVAPAVLLARLVAGEDGPTLSDIFRIPVDPPLPRGVREEEPVRWQLHRLERQAAAPDPGGACRARSLPHPTTARRSSIG